MSTPRKESSTKTEDAEVGYPPASSATPYDYEGARASSATQGYDTTTLNRQS